jgi:beta-lactamase class A
VKLSWLPALAGLCLLAAPAQADTLQNWRFDDRQNRLDFSTDEDVQPTAQLLANPSRLVIDLPGIKLGRPKLTQSIGGAVQSLRIGQFDARTTRLVVELAPGYTIDPQQIKVRGTTPTQWSVQLPQPQFSAAVAAADRAAAARPVPVAPAQPVAAIAPPVAAPDTMGGLVPAGQSLTWLQQRLAALKAKHSSLQPVIYILDLDTGNYVDLGGDKVFPTASIIKLPILIAFFQDVDAGKIRLDETLVMTPDLIVGGSGEMQDLPAYSKFSALDTASKMITISDNTATNMIIKRMGGLGVLNQRFRSWGLTKTGLRNWLPDLRGTNTTTPKELVRLLAMVDKNQLLSPQSRSQALGILRRVRNRSLLATGLGRGATIAHKTGDIGFMLGDAGLIEMPNGKHYLAAVLVKSGYNDPVARDFTQQVSRIVYTYLDNPTQFAVPAIGPNQGG